MGKKSIHKQNMNKKNPEYDNKVKLQQQTNQIFNIAEVPIMNYIAIFLEEDANAIYKDNIPTFTEPFILLPLDDYKKEICLKFNMVPVNSNNMAINPDNQKLIDEAVPMSDLVNYDKVREGIGFLYYCAKSVYTSVVYADMIDNKILANTKLELDQKDWSFYPYFRHEINTKKQFLEETLDRIVLMKKNRSEFSSHDMKDVDTEYHKIVDTLTQLNNEYTDEIKEIETNINKDFIDRPKMRIFITELHEDDLPKPITNFNEDMEAQNAKMPRISGPMCNDSIDT